jgi:hypothetical protein
LRSATAPSYSRERSGSKLDPCKDEIHRLLRDEPGLAGQRVRELIELPGFAVGKTIVDDYLREGRPAVRDAQDRAADCLSAGRERRDPRASAEGDFSVHGTRVHGESTGKRMRAGSGWLR